MQEDNVFGSSDIRECFNSVIQFVSNQLNVSLPNDPKYWRVTRVGFTENHKLDGFQKLNRRLTIFAMLKVEGIRFAPLPRQYIGHQHQD